ncbi:MAG: dockerin type I repeat-containing protein [Muribaculaceae bacterium]|nr:dockerin type I repeat-containing protein [Muribaculaceae bacterium]
MRHSLQKRVRTLMMLLMLLALPATVSAQFSGSGAGTKSDPYLIFNPSQLNQVRNFLGQSGVCFKLMNDLDMTSWLSTNSPTTGWRAIGSSSSPFKGEFLGEGYTIKGLKVENTSSDYLGLFGYLSEATVSNLNLEIDFSLGNSDYVGGLCGYSNLSTISEIRVTGKIEGGRNYLGGILGYSVDSKITDCHTDNMTITRNSSSTSYVGGCIGYARIDNPGVRYKSNSATSPISGLKANNVNIYADSQVGGVIGYVNFIPNANKSDTSYSVQITNQISNCFANGKIKASGSDCGGVIGQIYCVGDYLQYYYSYANPSNYRSYTAALLTISNCGSNVVLSSTGNGEYYGDLIGRILTGKTDSYTNSTYYGQVTLSNCFALGDIQASSNVGGLTGAIERDTYNNSNCKVLVYDSYYQGNVTGSGENVGGIVGSADNATIARCYSAGNVNGTKAVSGIIGKASSCSVKSSASLNENINASVSGVGRILGSYTSTSVGESGTSTSNKGYAFANLTENGAIINPSSNYTQNGDDQGEATMKLRATYQGIGWNFTNDWTNLETESYPYKVTQTVPPTISSIPETGSLVVRGRCINGGEVFVTLNGETVSAECDNNNNWVVRLESALQSGESLSVYAVAPGKFPSYSVSTHVSYLGSGTEEDPYQIYTPHDLASINGDAYYILMNDIDLSSYGDWTPIGRNGGAMCHLDGYNYTISGMTINADSTPYNGLFATLRNGSIKNLVIKDANVSGGDYTGILIGELVGSQISGCQTEGNVKGANYTAGLCGKAANSTITSTRVLADVTSSGTYSGGVSGYLNNTEVNEVVYDGTLEATSDYAGGISGYIYKSSVKIAFTSDKISAQGSNTYVGGIAGLVSDSSISESYSTADILSGQYAGGIAGYNYGKIENCYSSGNLKSGKYAGGIVGYNDGASASIKGCVAANEKIELSDENPIGMRVLGGIRNGAQIPALNDNIALEQMIISLNGLQQEIYDDPLNGVAKTEILLKSKAAYEELGWNFDKTWSIDGNGHYPYLKALGSEEGGSILPANFLTIDPITTEAGAQITMLVNMTNKDDLAGAQFDIFLPEGISIATDMRDRPQITLGSRINSMQHSIGSRLAPNGAMRVLITPRTVGQIYNFPGTVGDIAKIVLNVDPALVNGEYDVELKNIMFATPDGITTVYANNCKGHISVKNDKVTVEDVEGMPGKTSEIELNLINKSDIVGYQYDLILPEGVKIALNQVGKPAISHGDRTTTAVHGITCKEIAPNTLRVLSYPSERQTISGHEGVISKITLEIDKDMEKGVYPVHLKNIFLANTDLNSISVEDQQVMLTVKQFVRNGDVNVDGIINVSDVIGVNVISTGATDHHLNADVADLNSDGNVNVQDVTLETTLVYNELYPAMARSIAKAKKAIAHAPELPYGNLDVYFEPFVIQPGETKPLRLHLNNPENDIFAIQGRVYLPRGLDFVKDQYGLWGQPCERSEQDLIVAVSDLGDRWGFSFSNGLSLYEFWGNDGPVVEFYVHADESLRTGVYQVDFNDIQLSDPLANGFRSLDAPFTVVVGNPEYLESLELQGRLSEESASEFNTLLKNYESITELDLRGVKENKSSAEFKSANPNMLIYANGDVAVANKQNLVKDGECKNLVLEDGYDFNSSESFNAESASYTRSMAADEWDTLYLPYASELPSDVYVGSLIENHSSSISFDVADGVLNAHEPALIHSVAGGEKVFNASNVYVEATPESGNARFNGVYKKSTLQNAYHPAGSKDNITFNKIESLMPFRAYIRLAEDEDITTGIDAINADALSGSDSIFNLQGMSIRLNKEYIQPGIYIVNGKKVYITNK